MPVRLLSSPVLRWPDAAVVDAAARAFAQALAAAWPALERLGYFGSYARGDWGVGSDLDLIAIVDRAGEPFERRAARWDTTQLPVPASLLVYTRDEWERLRGGRFHATIEREAVWLHVR
jgi:hypothetical protein